VKKVILLVISVLFLLPCISFAADLDQPMTKQSTLQTEILRGRNAISNIDGYYDTVDYIGVVDQVIQYNQQRNTDTDGFYIGAYLAAWWEMDLLITTHQYNNSEELKLANEGTLAYYNEFRKRQAQYELSDQKLCEASGWIYDKIKPYFDKYWAKTHPTE
jgi:hypothetical protein